jgi:hypothetical protein
MWGTCGAHDWPDRAKNSGTYRWGDARTGSMCDSTVGADFELLGSTFLHSYAEASPDTKAALTPTQSFDARLARCPRATAGNEAHGASARDTPPRLVARRPQSCRQFGPGRRPRADLSKAVSLERLGALSLEHARARTAAPDRKQKAVLLAQPPALAGVSRAHCRQSSKLGSINKQKNCPPAQAPSGQQNSIDGNKVAASPACVNAGAVSTHHKDGKRAIRNLAN